MLILHYNSCKHAWVSVPHHPSSPPTDPSSAPPKKRALKLVRAPLHRPKVAAIDCCYILRACLFRSTLFMRLRQPLGSFLRPTSSIFHTAWNCKNTHRLQIALRYSSNLTADEMTTVDTTQRLVKLRQLMKERNVDVYGMCKVNMLEVRPQH